jgi:hypothetical protein
MPPGTKPGDACTTDGRTCSAVAWCDASAGALVTDDRAFTCTAGAWQAHGGDCPAAGALNADGCPLVQPADASSCTVAGAVCHYGRACVLGSCADAGPGCVAPMKALHAYATCTNGKWSTTPLAACP